MIYFFVVVLVFVLLILVLGLSVAIGRFFGRRQLQNNAEHKLEVDRVAEGAVFGLLALLIAFSFSGAYERLEARKMHVLEEANAFNTAYEYVDLLAPKFQPQLQNNIREYLGLHLKAYNDLPYLDLVAKDVRKQHILEKKIWKEGMAACAANLNKSLFILVIPALDNMIKAARTGINMARVHPPGIVFVLLIGLAASGAFLIGFNSARNKKVPIHVICYVIFIAFTIYIIINIEFPRSGFVRLNYFDRILLDVKQEMKD